MSPFPISLLGGTLQTTKTSGSLNFYFSLIFTFYGNYWLHLLPSTTLNLII